MEAWALHVGGETPANVVPIEGGGMIRIAITAEAFRVAAT